MLEYNVLYTCDYPDCTVSILINRRIKSADYKHWYHPFVGFPAFPNTWKSEIIEADNINIFCNINIYCPEHSVEVERF